ncbi:MAG: phosphorylcholine transferase LicD [Sphaerochaeta sp.]|uniref:LicD family protein n=2 Tax=unclassified Sphaerochaeta TaxID=2637943 RepID=UPI003D0D36D2
MKNLTHQELVTCELEILSAIDEFCTSRQITYFLSGGTLLGAVRHKGFIPWDDDIDLMMPRSDYDVFVKHFSSPKFAVYALETSPRCRFPFAKVYDTKTFVKEGAQNHDIEFGVFVDIFPLDVAPDDSKKIHKQVQKSRMYQQLLKVKMSRLGKHWSLLRNFLLIPGKLMVLPLSENWLARKINRIARSSSNLISHSMGCMVWGYGEREILDSDCFASSVPLEFENLVFPAPKGYHEYLSSLYGDYMQLPPVEKRVSKHDFVAYWNE